MEQMASLEYFNNVALVFQTSNCLVGLEIMRNISYKILLLLSTYIIVRLSSLQFALEAQL